MQSAATSTSVALAASLIAIPRLLACVPGARERMVVLAMVAGSWYHGRYIPVAAPGGPKLACWAPKVVAAFPNAPSTAPLTPRKYLGTTESTLAAIVVLAGE